MIREPVHFDRRAMAAVILGLVIATITVGCHTPAPVRLQETDSFRIGEALQIHSYAHLKGNLDWLMSTYRKSDRTSHSHDGELFSGWKEVSGHYQSLLEDRRIDHLDQSDLAIEMDLSRLDRATARIRRSFVASDGSVISSGIFTARFQKRYSQWLITGSDFVPDEQ
jgi:hypothetical protein